MIRFALALPLALLACSAPEENSNRATKEQEQLEAPIKDIEEVPADENAAAAVGEGDDAPAAGER